MKFNYGKWDSWGFALEWHNREKALAIYFVHWYFAITFYKLWKN